MEQEAEYLLHLLGAFIRQEKPRDPGALDLKRLKYLAHIHSVTGILGYMAAQHKLFPAEGSAFRTECMATISGFSQRAALAELFFEKLAEEGIDHILMKGFVVKDYYPIPELRTYGDLDIVIRRADREKCHALMQALGYRVKTDWEPVYSYVRPMEHYELHTELLETDISASVDCRDYFSDPWRYAAAEGRRYRFDPEYHFLYLLAHLAKHVAGSGAGARMYLDLAAFIRHFEGKLDWAWIGAELEKTRLAAFANTALAFVERYFGVESPIPLKPVEDEVLEALASMTAGGGVFGKVGLDSGVNALKDQTDRTTRLQTVARRLFPAAKTIETRYTYLQKRPWLLPAAWVHRLLLTRSTLKDHAREARSILKADREEAGKLRRFYREIGL